MTATATATTTTVTVPRSEIARGLKAASSIKAKAVRFDLSGEHIAIYAFSGDVATRTRVDAAGNPDAGAVSVPRPLIAGVMPYIGHDIALSIADEHLIVRSGDSEFQIRALREDAPPAEPATSTRRRGRRSFSPPPASLTANTHGHDLDLDGETFSESFTFDAPVLVETFRRALPFAGTDMTRPLLCNVAVYPDANVAAATDSYRLAVVRYGDESSKPEKDPLLFNTEGAKSMHALLSKKLGTVTVAPIDRFLIIDFEDTRWSLRRQMPYGDNESVKYPQWWDLIPDAKVTTTIKVDRDDMLAASRSARVVGSRNTPLILRAHAKGASVAANALTAAKMTRRLSSAGVIGCDMEIGFNPEFMADICMSAPVERIAVKLIGPLRPALVEAARDQYLLMPIRLNV